MRWERGRYAIEMTDDPCYSFGSMDNTHTYAHVYLFGREYAPSSKHGLACSSGGEARGTAIVAASGGGTVVHEHSCVLLDDRCIVAVGDRAVALGVPALVLLWETKADSATCFGLHVTADQQHLVVHGELEISKLSVNGQKVWGFTGRDVFTGECSLADGTVVATDFSGKRYTIDLQRGVATAVGARPI